MDYRTRKTELAEWYVMENQDPLKLRTYLEDLIKINSVEYEKQQYQNSNNFSPNVYNSPLPDIRTAQK